MWEREGEFGLGISGRKKRGAGCGVRGAGRCRRWCADEFLWGMGAGEGKMDFGLRISEFGVKRRGAGCGVRGAGRCRR